MNLIQDAWLPVIRRDGTHATIAPWELGLQNGVSPPIALNVPRADLRAAGHELLIGMYATALAVSGLTRKRWEDLQHRQVAAQDIRPMLEVLAAAFNLDGPAPRFMQASSLADQNASLKKDEATKLSIASILLDMPDNITNEPPKPSKNRDWFETIPQGDFGLTATALSLYAHQAYATEGGRGHCVGYRGGGPLTTLVLPKDGCTLLEMILANVPMLNVPVAVASLPFIFWWMPGRWAMPGPAPDHVHSLHPFFATPRPVWLDFKDAQGLCAIMGQEGSRFATGYWRTLPATNYGGCMTRHFLSPYNPARTDKSGQQKSPERSVRTPPGGIGWYHHMGFAVMASGGVIPAGCVEQFRHTMDGQARLLVTGFISKQNKINGFVEETIPLMVCRDVVARDRYDDAVQRLVSASVLAFSALTSAVWYSLTSRDRGADSSKITLVRALDRLFWSRTQSAFEGLLMDFGQHTADGTPMGAWEDKWRKFLMQQAETIFGEMVCFSPASAKIVKVNDKTWGVKMAKQRRSMMVMFAGKSKAGEAFFTQLGLPIS